MVTAQRSGLSGAVMASITSAIAAADADLRALSVDIHAHPELAWEEHYAHDRLTAFMEQQGFKVTRNAYGLATAWKAEYEVGTGGRTIGFNSEMDALRGLGHACGHNLIAISGCAAAIGVAQALREHSIPGRVVLIGTPAEEQGGGKTKLIKAGAYEGMDACLMVHPAGAGNGGFSMSTNCIAAFSVTYHGKSAHAAGAPEKAINALDAAVAAYTNVSLLRQQLPSTSRVHGVILGSENFSVNVIPSEAKISYGIRAPTATEMMSLIPRVLNCFKAAALATGCEYQIYKDMLYLNLEPTAALEEYHREVCGEMWGAEGYVAGGRQAIGASTDFGDVTYHVPALHPGFELPGASPSEFPHSDTYTAAALTPSAHSAATRAATGIALVGARVVIDAEFAEEVKRSWRGRMDAIGSKKLVRELGELMGQYPQNGGEGKGCAC